MNKLFRPKTMRRMAVFMALVAPIVYLFGVSFAGLAGAHGNSPFDTDTEILVDNRKVDFNQLFYRNNFSRSVENLSIDYVNGYFSFDALDGAASYFTNIDSYDVVANHTYVFSTSSTGDSMGSGRWQFYMVSSLFSTIYYVDSYAVFTPSSNGIVYARFAYYGGTLSGTGSINLFDITQMYGVDASVNDLVDDYSLANAYPYVLSQTDYFPVYAVPDGSQYWFSQFFARDNFLERWGENAISDDPYGFAPFGYFWRYLDANVLHLSNEQVGLMAYGYMYYASHVLLFDVGFILVTFFLTFIQKVADRIGGEDHA